MRWVSVLAASLKPVVLVRAPASLLRVVCETEGFTSWLQVLHHCSQKLHLPALAPKSTDCGSCAANSCHGSGMGSVIAAWDGWKNNLLSFELVERPKFIPFNMVSGGKSDSVPSALEDLFRNWIASDFLSCTIHILILFQVPQSPCNGILDGELGNADFSWTLPILRHMEV